MNEEIRAMQAAMEREGYIAEPTIATAVFLAKEMQKPLLVEGEAGVGKTEIAKVLARMLQTELIRLQCYEGLDTNTALYEWNYQRQLLRLKVAEHEKRDPAKLEELIFGREYLLERPLLRAITRREGPAVLLIDEIDRADEGFEAFLLEVLSDFQITIPELGTIRAEHLPFVVLTSSRSREIGDVSLALERAGDIFDRRHDRWSHTPPMLRAPQTRLRRRLLMRRRRCMHRLGQAFARLSARSIARFA